MMKKNKQLSPFGHIIRDHLVIVATIVTVLVMTGGLYVLAVHPEFFWSHLRPVEQPVPQVVVPIPSSTVTDLKTPSVNTAPRYQSTNWAGYLSTGGSFTSISAYWKVPSSTAASAVVESGSATWIGIGGVTSKDLIQVGTETTISPSGIVSVSAFYEMLPEGPQSIPSIKPLPGDTISASITEISPSRWAISIKNETTGAGYKTIPYYASSRSSAQWIQENSRYPDSSFMVLDNFGTVQFTDAYIVKDGISMSAAESKASPITLIGQGGSTGHSAIPSTLTDGLFTISYR